MVEAAIPASGSGRRGRKEFPSTGAMGDTRVRGRVVVRDRLRAMLTLSMLIVGLGLLFTYIVTDMPGLTPAARRSAIVPSHPSAVPVKIPALVSRSYGSARAEER